MVSLAFVIATMLEFAIVLWIKRRQNYDVIETFPSILLCNNERNSMDGGNHDASKTMENGWMLKTNGMQSSCIAKIDIIALLVFTFSYVIFNCLYFLYLM